MKSRLRFGLSTLLVAITGLSILFGYVRTNIYLPALRREAAVRHFKAMGGTFGYASPAMIVNPPRDASNFYDLSLRYDWNYLKERTPQLSGPAWARGLCGERYFEAGPTGLHFQQGKRDVVDDDLALLEGLTELKVFNPYRTVTTRIPGGVRTEEVGYLRITDRGIEHLAKVQSLEHLVLRGSKVTDEGVSRLVTGLPRLRSLSLARTKITDASVDRLAALPRLEQLDVSDTQITRTGLSRLRSLRPDIDVRGSPAAIEK